MYDRSMTIDAIRSQNGLFAILELDRSYALAEQLSLDLTVPENLDFIYRVNQLLLELSKEVTALVFDPVYSFPLLPKKDGQAASLIRLEQNKEFLATELPDLFPDFSLEEIRNNYSLAKLELFYHPKEARAMEKKQLLAEIKSYCQSLGIDFLLKLNIYDYSKFQEEGVNEDLPEFSYTESQLEAVQELRSMADILALKAPEDPLMLATLSTELDVPWVIVANAEESYQDFKDRFRMAVENGASGYMLGDLLWTEIASFRLEDQSFDFAAIEKYIRTTVRDRIIELNRIAVENLADIKE